MDEQQPTKKIKLEDPVSTADSNHDNEEDSKPVVIKKDKGKA